ncbi:MAG: SsrA-binding protein SmpB [Patescibacteria group bacterium]
MSLVENKKFFLKYETLETLEAGIELFGYEVKSVRARQGSLDGARVLVRGGEAYLLGANIPPYQPNNTPAGYDPERNRRLLLHKSEIAHLSGLETRKGLTIVPISMYNKGRAIKLSIALARGKKKYDKRADIKKRESDREIRRLKHQTPE